MIRFNNDYNRGAFDCILKALADTNTTSYPGYGEDEWCDKAEQIIKGLIGRDDSMIKFIPGATQAIRSWNSARARWPPRPRQDPPASPRRRPGSQAPSPSPR